MNINSLPSIMMYVQVYQWIQKYDEQGETGLQDKRGKHKSDDELTEIGKLQREN